MAGRIIYTDIWLPKLTYDQTWWRFIHRFPTTLKHTSCRKLFDCLFKNIVSDHIEVFEETVKWVYTRREVTCLIAD